MEDDHHSVGSRCASILNEIADHFSASYVIIYSYSYVIHIEINLILFHSHVLR